MACTESSIIHYTKIDYGSAPWCAARALRYALFFAPVGLPESVLDDAVEQGAQHWAALADQELVAYGRLAYLGDGLAQISQMVVAPAWQGQGAGWGVLQQLIAAAQHKGVRELMLNARVTAQAFYAKAGFVPEGDVYVATTTGVPHIKMRRVLGREKSLQQILTVIG